MSEDEFENFPKELREEMRQHLGRDRQDPSADNDQFAKLQQELNIPKELKDEFDRFIRDKEQPSQELAMLIAEKMNDPATAIQFMMFMDKSMDRNPPTRASLPEYKVSLSKVNQDGTDKTVDVYDCDTYGQRTKLGGVPDFTQTEDVEDVSRCEQCGQFMTFVAQIDSIEHDWPSNPLRKELGEQKWMFLDVGMIYVFHCFNCGNSSAFAE